MSKIKKQEKFHTDLNFTGYDLLYWYTGIYLGHYKLFVKYIKNTIVPKTKIDAVLIPSTTVKDPVTGRDIVIHLTDRYFFIGSKHPLCLNDGFASLTTVTFMMMDESTKLKETDVKAIKKVCESSNKRPVLHEGMTVKITHGTFKKWRGYVEKVDKEFATIRFTCDQYSYITQMPLLLCQESNDTQI
jgi:transcription antitermination factor NusG